ncbi:acetyl-CoA C-acetyltransferase [Vallitalea okinawensis]|uniref:acetyl-CoA C-acetyltransferase n=1 Tax=Vallitalea okinawensis TaxID=2078660 RepID=UPI000CFD0F0B|nr:acetyl-CoA C-acetyltransferase [Vallitalea okinawensis]
MMEVVILSAVRTPIGSFGGTLKEVKAVELGKIVMQQSISHAKINYNHIDEIMFGCVLQGGLGQNVARQSSLLAGIPDQVPSTTINQVCGSGLKSVGFGVSSIKSEMNNVVLVGGTENMSQSNYILEEARFGHRMGDKKVVDAMIRDGLWDAINDYHMGITAENVADMYQITREEQDKFAVNSQNKAEKAQEEGRFTDEIVPVAIQDRKGKVKVFEKDEYIRYNSTMDRVAKLSPAFKANGTVTAANASGINDGAAAIVLASESFAKEQGLVPMAKVVAYGSVGLDPAIMGLGPIEAIRKVLNKANLTIDDIDLFEVNEAFAAQSIAVVKELNLDSSKVNVNGGAIALGHPIGASGARILVTLLHELKRRNLRYGIAALCIGGGQGTAVLVENIRQVE